MSVARNQYPESSETKWLAALLLIFIVGIAVWFGMRWILVFPLFFWALIHYDGLYILGFLDENGQRWRSFVHSALRGLLSGEFSSMDFGWSQHLMPIHEDITRRVYWFWIFVFGMMTLYVLFRSKGGGLVRVFSLSGMSRRPVFRFLGIAINNRLIKGILNLLGYVTLLRKFLVTDKKEWVKASPSFIDYQSLAWKTSVVATRFRPDGGNIPEPSMTPAEWILKFVAPRCGGAESVSVDVFKTACFEAMKSQLGPRWGGLKSAKPHVKAMLVLMYVNRRKGEAESRVLADRLAGVFVSSSPSKRESALLGVVASQLSAPDFQDAIRKWTSSHAWTNTAVLSVYGRCGPFKEWGGGKSGVLPTASFLWLKQIDRSLWYALNNVGRRAFHCEGAGSVCHFFHERLAGKPLVQPFFEEAIIGREDEFEQGKLHGFIGYLRDNGMMPDTTVVDFGLMRRVIEDSDDS